MNASGFTLTANGTGFVSSSIIRFDGVDRTTSFVSDSQLTDFVSFSELTTAGTIAVTVFTPGGGESAAVTFTIANPVPTISSISPSSKSAGGFLKPVE